jgi:hypothetical protein
LIGEIANRFAEKGALSDNSTREFLQKFMTAYADWLERDANAPVCSNWGYAGFDECLATSRKRRSTPRAECRRPGSWRRAAEL